MAKGKNKNMLGSWAFLVGFVLAIVIGLFGTLTANLVIALAVIGLIVGLLNIADEEAAPFLMAGAVLVIVATFGQNVMASVPAANGILQALLALFVPATLIVAVRSVFSLARK